jgi:hypothetical protein
VFEKFFYQDEPDDEDFVGNMIAGFSGGNFLHILSLKTRNIIDAISSIIAPNDPRRKAPVVFIEA